MLKNIDVVRSVVFDLDEINEYNLMVEQCTPMQKIKKDGAWFCPVCASLVAESYSFCPRCGQRIDKEEEDIGKTKKTSLRSPEGRTEASADNLIPIDSPEFEKGWK